MEEINYSMINEFINKYKKEVNKKFKRCECVYCHDPIRMEDFINKLSLREFGISGLCQDYQNDVFEGK